MHFPTGAKNALGTERIENACCDILRGPYIYLDLCKQFTNQRNCRQCLLLSPKSEKDPRILSPATSRGQCVMPPYMAYITCIFFLWMSLTLHVQRAQGAGMLVHFDSGTLLKKDRKSIGSFFLELATCSWTLRFAHVRCMLKTNLVILSVELSETHSCLKKFEAWSGQKESRELLWIALLPRCKTLTSSI